MQVSDCCGAKIDYDIDKERDEAVLTCTYCGEECEIVELPEPEEIAIRRGEWREDR